MMYVLQYTYTDTTFEFIEPLVTITIELSTYYKELW